MRDKVVIGSRGSALALVQTHWVVDQLRALRPGLTVEVQIIKTTGDKITEVPLAMIGDKGLFVKELENALLAHETDLAVHSMKDLPTQIPQGLAVPCVPGREDPHDALVLPGGVEIRNCDSPLEHLTNGARIGSSSLRRQAQLLHARPDFAMLDLRGNLDTRLRKLDEGHYDAIILAVAGLTRLGKADRIACKIPFEDCLPAVGQGALAIECRADDAELMELLAEFDDKEAHTAVLAERALMNALDGGCQIPVGANARIENGMLVMEGMIAGVTGKEIVRDRIEGPTADAESLGAQLAQKLLTKGGREILEKLRKG